MRSDADVYSLGGMGCAAGNTAAGLAAKLLKSLPKGGLALVVNHEHIYSAL